MDNPGWRRNTRYWRGLQLRRSVTRNRAPRLVMSFLFRFLIGGLVVCAFASLADALKPKTFAGIFGAAPSVALATLALTVSQEGNTFATEEARSMLAGATAFVAYALTCLQLIARLRWNPLRAATASLAVWFAVAAVLWPLVRR
jgi:uncharacterized membrane protein (GlpM family)